MPARPKAKDQPVYTDLAIELDSFIVRLNAGINSETHDTRYAGSDTKIYCYYGHIELTGKCNYPEERVGQEYRIDIYGRERETGEYSKTLADFHVKDRHGHPKYRKRGTNLFPVYEPPDSIGFIDRRRGTQFWSACVWTPSDAIADMITLLSHIDPLYASIREVKVGRTRNIRTITLQTSDPSEE